MNRKIFNWLCPTKLVEKVFSHTAGAWDGVKWSKATSYHPPTLPAMETKLICLHIYLLLTSPCSELSNPSICGRRGNPRILWSTQRETKILHYWFYMAFYQVRIFASQLPRNVWALRGGENNFRSHNTHRSCSSCRQWRPRKTACNFLFFSHHLQKC